MSLNIIFANQSDKMMKKVLTIVFMLLANLVLLAHAVVPHHHHIIEICIEDSNCHSDAEDHQHESSKSHDHNDETDTDQCILKQAWILPSNQFKPDFKSFENGNGLFKIQYSLAILSNLKIAQKDINYAFREDRPFSIKIPDCYIGNSHSHRGPPIV